MKIAIVYYSKSGNTRCVAQLLADQIRGDETEVDLIEIEAVKTPGFLKAGYASWRQLELPIKNTNIDVDRYDFIITGSPVWGGKPAPFIGTFLKKAKNIEGKKAAFFITGAGEPDTQSKARKLFRDNLEKSGLKPIDCSLALQMQKGEILLGEQGIGGFVEAISSSQPSSE